MASVIQKTLELTSNKTTSSRALIPRIGGPVSNAVDIISHKLEKVGAEIAILSGSFLRGAIAVCFDNLKESTKNMRIDKK